MSITLQQLVDYLVGFDLSPVLQGDPQTQVQAINGLDQAKAGDLSFLSDSKYIEHLAQTQATAVLLKPEHSKNCLVNAISVSNPYAAYALVAQLLYKENLVYSISARAEVAGTAVIADKVFIGAQAVISERVELAEGVIVGAGCVLQAGVKIGKNTRLAPNVTIMHDCIIGENCIVESGTVIGGDGFGWARHQGQWIKIPQIGRVIIGNHVSLGNNCTVDRGAIDDTVIEDNCIIDNLVHIAHNVKIGSGTAIAGQVGFAGSAVVGKNCTFAGQAGMVGHIELTDGVTIMGRGVATHSIHQPGVYSGFPAVPVSEWQKNAIYAKNLGRFSDKIKQLNIRLKKLENQD